ncbi:MAG TPA: COQ9 family protein [Hellea balneolensis]|uniref:COQ9 family protein n=1 Tax=Hellea balneolensis TaxID=287478 RepID=A0A7C5QVJ7_9PROT|nr:COQ9 family protein [Hellea balneolensis]
MSRKTQTDLSHKARLDILEKALPLVPFEGWSSKTLRMAVKDAGLPKGAEELYFSGGPLELIEFWNEQMDAVVLANLAELDLPSMRIRDKVTAGVLARFYALGPHEEAARRAIARTALPDGLSLGPKILWKASDTIWRGIADTSTDFNYYTKRTTLSAVISTSLAAWLSDDEPEKEKARKFLDARIENVMQFEKAKFKVKNRVKNMPDPLSLLGQLRHGRKRRRRRS